MNILSPNQDDGVNDHDAWYQLFGAALNGTLSDEDHQKLQSILKTNGAARQLWFEFNDVECGLSELRPFSIEHCLEPVSFSNCECIPSETNVAEAKLGAGLKWGSLAAAAAVVLGLGVHHSIGRIETAEFGNMHDPLWASPEQSFKSGDAIASGQVLELFSGSVDVRFGSGAEVTLVAPCIFQITSSNSANLTFGQVKARAATAAAKGFTIQTPTASVVDVGTEFVAFAEADGKSRVEVTSGEVQVHLAGQQEPQRLLEGNALAVEPGQPQVMIRMENGDGTPEFRFPSIEPPSEAAASGLAGTLQGRTAVRLLDGHKMGGSGPLPALAGDASVSAVPGMVSGTVIQRNAESGQILVDLGQEVSVNKINTYSWIPLASTQSKGVVSKQKYALYGYPDGQLPRTDGELDDHGWDLIGRVDSDSAAVPAGTKGTVDQQVSSISAASGSIGRYRYLLWAVQPVSGGVKLADASAFYGEFDVYAAQ